MGYVTRGPQENDDESGSESGDPPATEPIEPARRAKPLGVTPAAKVAPPSSTRSPGTPTIPSDTPTLSTDVEDDEDEDDVVDADIEPVEAEPVDEDGELEYELDEWAEESRAMLDQLLTGAEIAHVWQGATLVVRALDEAAVDEYVDHVETTTLPTLDPEAEKVSYEIDDLDDFKQDHLFDLLEGQEIAYEIDAEGELVVLAADEEAVDVIMEAIDFPNALAADDDESGDQLDREGLPMATDVLSDLFVAVDRLQHKATDAKGVLGVVDATEHLPKLRVPYGFDVVLWKKIVDDAVELQGLLEDDESYDEDIEEKAKALRAVLHEVV